LTKYIIIYLVNSRLYYILYKDNIHRILKKIFTNECAMNCSMKGIRNNFQVGNLNIIRIIKSMCDKAAKFRNKIS